MRMTPMYSKAHREFFYALFDYHVCENPKRVEKGMEIMGKKKKDTIELRFYEIPQNEYVLALLGENWVRDYGHDEPNLHFHNLMEIGYCRNGRGEITLNEEIKKYEPNMFSVIPQNFPHTTISDLEAGRSFWEYIYFEPAWILQEIYPDNPLEQREAMEKINQKASLVFEWEKKNLAILIKTIMEEMREKKPHYRECVKGLLIALMTELIRMTETVETKREGRKRGGITQISEALEFVRVEYARNLKVEDLANVCHMSETHFRRIFESYMNMPPMDYINLVRVQKACDIMKKTNDSMDVVAQRVGFTTTSTFNRNFKKFLGTSPYQWKIKPENYERKLLDFHISVLKGW